MGDPTRIVQPTPITLAIQWAIARAAFLRAVRELRAQRAEGDALLAEDAANVASIAEDAVKLHMHATITTGRDLEGAVDSLLSLASLVGDDEAPFVALATGGGNYLDSMAEDTGGASFLRRAWGVLRGWRPGGGLGPWPGYPARQRGEEVAPC